MAFLRIPSEDRVIDDADAIRAFLLPHGIQYERWPVEGRIDGVLVDPPRGTAGFGYDPCFLPQGHSRTFGEMTSDEKHGLPADGSLALSHRARAFQMLAKACLD
jgi:inosine/xanthosine triphosphate pyrophosphatase family protein